MSIDLELIRKKVNQLSGKNKKTESVFWKPTPGEYLVRIIPFKNNDGMPFKERLFYYNIAKFGILAPKQFGKDDPVQELINKLREENSPESLALAKKLYPKMRAFAAIVVRGQEDKCVQLWSMGREVYNNLLQMIIDPDYGDITDPLEGRDIKVVLTKADGAEYAKTSLTPRPKSTPLSVDPATSKTWIAATPDIDEIYQEKSYAEIKQLVEAWLNADEPAPQSDGKELQTKAAEVAPTKASTPAPKKKTLDIDKAFEELDGDE